MGTITYKGSPLHRRPSAQRVADAMTMLNRWVEVDVDPLRGAGPRYTVAGELVSVATVDHGTTRDVLVLRRPGELDHAVPLAQVARIRPAARPDNMPADRPSLDALEAIDRARRAADAAGDHHTWAELGDAYVLFLRTLGDRAALRQRLAQDLAG